MHHCQETASAEEARKSRDKKITEMSHYADIYVREVWYGLVWHQLISRKLISHRMKQGALNRIHCLADIAQMKIEYERCNLEERDRILFFQKMFIEYHDKTDIWSE